MRIIAGQWRGRPLAAVGKGDVQSHLRPTTDRTRESLFSMLEGGRFGSPIEGAQVLDLFAGTGALGLESLSRGAQSATFVETGRAALKLLATNISTFAANAHVLRTDATRLQKNSGEPATLVFLDPPYGAKLGEIALTKASAGRWIGDCALVVWEESNPQVAPKNFKVIEEKRYGETWITFLRHDP